MEPPKSTFNIDIMSQGAFATFISSLSISTAVHVLDRYNKEIATTIPEHNVLLREATDHFLEDSCGQKQLDMDCLSDFFEKSGRYDASLFLETLYFSIFWPDFIMQKCSDKDVYMPIRNEYISAIDAFLYEGLGYGKAVNEINIKISERCAGYGKNPRQSPLLFAANVMKYVLNPDVYSLRAYAYISLSASRTLEPLFINRASNSSILEFRCRKCRDFITVRIGGAPIPACCQRCKQEYLIKSVWAEGD